MENVRGVNHGLSISGNFIYDSNYKRALPLIKEPLDVIFSPYKDYDDMYAYFGVVLYAVSYVNPK